MTKLQEETKTLIRLKYGTPTPTYEFMDTLPDIVIDRVFSQINKRLLSPVVFTAHPKLYIQNYLSLVVTSAAVSEMVIVELVRYHNEE